MLRHCFETGREIFPLGLFVTLQHLVIQAIRVIDGIPAMVGEGHGPAGEDRCLFFSRFRSVGQIIAGDGALREATLPT